MARRNVDISIDDKYQVAKARFYTVGFIESYYLFIEYDADNEDGEWWVTDTSDADPTPYRSWREALEGFVEAVYFQLKLDIEPEEET